MKLRVAKKIITNSYRRVRQGTWNKAERVWDRWVLRGERKTIWYNKSELQGLVFGDDQEPNLQIITTDWPTNTCVSIQLDLKSVEDYVKRQQEIEQEIIKSLNIPTKLHNPTN